MWPLASNDLATNLRPDIQGKTLILGIMCNSLGFDIINNLQNDPKINSEYFVTYLISPFEQAIFPRGRESNQKQLMVHVDNYSVHRSTASAHLSEEHDLVHNPQPSYSIYLAPSDFYVFLPVQLNLESIQVVDDNELLDRMQEHVADIDQAKLNRIFQARGQRIQEVSQGNLWHLRNEML
jgi:hypothetical protein